MVNLSGRKLGNYQMLQLLGTGGFADVYLGKHVYLTTSAAIKVLQTRLEEDEQERFLQEARIIARLVHPHIIRVLDFGVEGAIPFLVMDYARGGNLRQHHPKGTRLTSQEILPYLQQIASALQYAHQQNLIHRDIKPENMLLGQNHEVLLSDFGIALIAQSTHFESTQEVYGTATYMAPEQIQGKAQPASDQYSLGVVIYEWLCGEAPFHGSFSELCSQHLFASLPPLREKVATISPALEAVVEKALAKNPDDRFPDMEALASAFAEAVEEEQIDVSGAEPTVRRPMPVLPTPPAETQDSAATHYAASSVSKEEKSEEAPSLPPTQPVSFTTLRLPLLPSGISTRLKSISRRNMLIGMSAAGLVAASGLTWYLLAQQGEKESSTTRFTAPPSPPTSTQTLGTTLFVYKEHTNTVQALSWSPNGQYLASGSGDTTVRVWNASSGETLYTYHGHSNLLDSVFAVEWSSNGRRITSGGADKTVQVWEAANGNRTYLYNAHTARVLAVSWSPDCRYIASGSADKTVRVWEADTGIPLAIYSGHADTVYTLSWSPDGKFLASGSADKTVHVWEANTSRPVFAYTGHTETVYTVTWSPDGKMLASGGGDRSVQVWEAATGKRISTYDGHHGLSNVVTSAAWSPDSKRLASGSTDKTAQIWEATTAKHIYTYDKHSDSIYALKWSFDGQHIASGSADNTVRVWQAS